MLLRGTASNHLLKTSFKVSKYRWPSELAHRGPKTSIHTPELEWGASLHTGAMDVLLVRASLTLYLTRVALLEDAMDFWDQPEHIDPFPTEVRSGGDASMSQELMSGFDDLMAQGVGDIEMLAQGPFFLSLKTPEAGGRILMQGRQECKEPPLVSSCFSVSDFCTSRRCSSLSW